MIALIVAASENNVIGRNGDLPWHLPDDLKYFRKITSGKPVIMGRKNFESIEKVLGGPLPKRQNIVVTRNKEWNYPGVHVANDLEGAIGLASMNALLDFDSDIFIIGGGEIYRQALEQGLVDRVYLTRIHAEIEGDVYFPALGPEWQEISREKHEKDENHEFSFSFLVFESR